MWEYEVNRQIRKAFVVTFFDLQKNYRSANVRANGPDEALVIFTQDYPRMEILSVRVLPV